MENPLVFRLVSSFVQVTILALMFSVGIRLTIEETTYLLKHPKRLLISLLSVDLIWPIIATIIILLVPLSPEARVALALMIACPGAPLTSRRVEKATGNVAYGANIQLAVSLLAVITVPLTLIIIFSLLPFESDPLPRVIARQVAFVQLLPIGSGLLIRKYFPKTGERIAGPSVKIGNILFILLCLLVLTQVYGLLVHLSPMLVLTIVLIVAAGLVLGHFLGGSDLESRQSLAIATIARNAGLAIYLASRDFGELTLLPFILAYLILSFLSETIYKRLLKLTT